MKAQKPIQSGFTLIEMLVVIAIIVLLASLLFPAINSALKRAQQTRCMSNLRNFGIAWNTHYLAVKSGPYANELEAVFPWLSAMVPEYLDASILVCPADSSHGEYGSKPNESQEYIQRSGDSINNSYSETDDITGNPHPDRNPDVEVCSYMYEFNAADCDWWEGAILTSDGTSTAGIGDIDIDGDDNATWGEVKLAQLKFGDTFSSGDYDPSQFPLVRCFHHYDDKEVRIEVEDNEIKTSVRVLNVAMDAHVFLSGMSWEYPLAQ